MKNLLLIGGGRRGGNCSIILKQIKEQVSSKKVNVELIDLKSLNINDCFGCDKTCDYKRGCVQKDDMAVLLEKMLKADMLVIASPNYFMNVSAIVKRFFDRTMPFHKDKPLRGKKTIFIFTGSLMPEITESTVKLCANGWARPMKVDWIDTFIFQAEGIGEFKDIEDKNAKMEKLIKEIKEQI